MARISYDINQWSRLSPVCQCVLRTSWLQLGSLIVVFDKYEALLFYEQVGEYGPCERRPQGKTLNILDPRASVYGQWTDWLVMMFKSYPAHGHIHGDWRMIAASGCSSTTFRTQRYAKWLRAQFLFLHSSATRAYGCKFESAPYFFWRIGNPKFTFAQQIQAAQRLIDCTSLEATMFGEQLRKQFDTVETIMDAATEIHQIIHRCFLFHHYDSGLIENLNSQTQHLCAVTRARARSLMQVSNEHLMSQCHGVR